MFSEAPIETSKTSKEKTEKGHARSQRFTMIDAGSQVGARKVGGLRDKNRCPYERGSARYEGFASPAKELLPGYQTVVYVPSTTVVIAPQKWKNVTPPTVPQGVRRCIWLLLVHRKTNAEKTTAFSRIHASSYSSLVIKPRASRKGNS